MPKRKGRKPPKPHPSTPAKAVEVAPVKRNGKGRVYLSDQRRRLWNRLMKIVGTEQRIDEIMAAMERAGLAFDMANLKRKLKRAGIYPPRVDNQRDRYKICFGACCKGLRSHPAYYVAAGLDYDAREGNRVFKSSDQVESESMTAAEADDREEIDRLRGESPGVVARMERGKAGRSKRGRRAA